MFGTVIITFVITTLGMLVLLLSENTKKQNRETERLRKSNERLTCQINDMVRHENTRRESAAYEKGLHDGRATDTLYRKTLKRYSSGDQATVMMYGEDESQNTKKVVS